VAVDTIKRLAELLKISPLSLLGIGVEYISRPAFYYDRIRVIEESCDQILQVFGPVAYLVTTDGFDTALAEVYAEAAEAPGADRAALRAQSDQLLNVLLARKRTYQQRRPSITAILSIPSLQRFLEGGVAAGVTVSDRVRTRARAAAAAEVEHIAALMEAEPIGVQLGLMTATEPNGNFKIMRSRDRAHLAINPFRLDAHPASQTGVAMITGADEAIALHQKSAEQLWREALKGGAAAARVRDLVRSQRIAA
ncbi:MAG: transcriptional regulator, partial [Acetobacteraceae bacterium]